MPATLTLEPLEFREATDAYRGKVRVSPGDFTAMTDAAKRVSFAVAGLQRGAALEIMHAALTKAIQSGTTFPDFMRDIGPVLADQGYDLSDSDTAWRLESMFVTNVLGAYADGRFQQLQAVKATRPYWLYRAVQDNQTRPSHAAQNGTIRHADDDYWASWYPPNGYRCRCRVESLSAAQVRAEGLEPPPAKGVPPPKELPDPGFRASPAQGPQALQALAQQGIERDTGDWADNIRKAQPTPPLTPRSQATRDAPADTEAARALFDEVFGLSADEPVRVVADVAGAAILIDGDQLFDHLKDGDEIKRDRANVLTMAAQTLFEPDEIRVRPQTNAVGAVRITRNYFRVFETDDEAKPLGMQVVVENKTGALVAWTVIPAGRIGSFNKQRETGVAIYAR
jgi:SPP1 gp7 family putative phage head morphogenesis protein